MVGQVEPFRRVPFFWTYQFGTAVAVLGHAPAWDEVIFDGEPERRDFLAVFLDQGRFAAAAAVGRDRQLAALHELVLLGREPRPEELRRGGLDLEELLRRG
jgi:hypothetical protein